jgi:cyclic-di-GMP phosphodiesterase TipF (flagellum assembly factor)
MSLFNHILIATCYTLVAAGVAIALPYGFAAIDPNAAVVVGGVVLAGSALLHEVFARQDGEGKLADALQVLRLEQGDARRELDQSRNRLRNLQRSLEQVVEEHKTLADEHRNFDTVVAEVKVLQGLIEQLSARTKGKAAPKRDAVRAPASATATATATARQPVTESAAAANLGIVAPAEVGSAPAVPDLDDENILRLVRDGLEGNRVDLVLQPIVSLPQRRLKFYEAFTRIRDGQGSVLMPHQYIAIAEREGLISAIDNMLLFRCVQLVRRSQQRKHNIGFFCNISAHSLTDRHFFNNFVEFMADNVGLTPNLIFEFAQSTIVNRDAEMESHLRHLAKMGFRFSMDQITSLNLDYDDLMRNHIKYVKIEVGTLLNELHNPTTAIAVEDIKRMVDRHGIDLVVEKIETEPALLELLDFRIDFGQGYLFGEPRLSRAE